MSHRSAFTLVEVLIVIIILGILAAAIIPQFTSAADDGRANSTAIVVRAMMRKVSAERAKTGSYPTSITADMFEGSQVPRNPLFPDVTEPAFSTATTDPAESDLHPASKVGSDNTVWWYNSANGVVRALVPSSLSDTEKVGKYNEVNNTSITDLDD